MTSPKGENFRAQIIDFNPRRMNTEEAAGIPTDLRPLVADKRQYPLHIGSLLPTDVAWYSPGHPWFFRDVLSNSRETDELNKANVLILTGSGMSAFQYQNISFAEGPPGFEDTLLMITEQKVKDFMAQGKSVFANCFGGQLGVLALGGKIGRLPEVVPGTTTTEAGWLSQRLTEAGKRDPIFGNGNLPEQFYAPHFHNDYVAELPPVALMIPTDSGRMFVVKSEVLAVRNGYLGKNGLEHPEQEFIMASVIEVDTGAVLYQVQAHPEMSVRQYANFLVRQNPWLADEMGSEYYEQALTVPEEADFSAANIIPNFIALARERYEASQKIMFSRAAIAQNLGALYQHMIK